MNNSLEQIKLLSLTSEDFKLLVDGLDALPEKGTAGEMMGDLFLGLLSKGDEETMAKHKAQREADKRKREKEKEVMSENVKILQGKLLMLKRYLDENKLLADTYEVLNLPSKP